MLPYYQHCHRFLALLLILLTVVWLGSDTPPTMAEASPAQPSPLSLADLPTDDQHTILNQIQAADYHLTPHPTDTGQTAFQTYQLSSNNSWQQLAKPTASDGAAGDWFGYDVAINGNTIVVGANKDDDKGDNSGSAYIFTRNQDDAGGWNQVKKLIPSDGIADSEFGISVAISSDTAVIGAYGNNNYTGAAYVFERHHNGLDKWGQVTKLTASNANINDGFGIDVAIDGDILIIGAAGDNSAAGAAYVFERRQDGTNDWTQVTRLTASDAVAEALFGWSVSISGDMVVFGAYGGDNSSGAAYVFERNQDETDEWNQIKKLTLNNADAKDWFGSHVAINDDTIVIGDIWDNSWTGAAYVFERNQGGVDNWGQVRKLTAPNGTADNMFGVVTINHDTIVVGANGEDSSPGLGLVYIFERNQGGADNWGQTTKFTASDTDIDDYFGSSVALNSNTLIVGAIGNDDAGEDSGAAYVFGLTSTSPDMTVLGNGQAIADGSTTPSPANHTDFGSVSLGSAITRTFTISNSGSAALDLTGSPAVTLTTATAFNVPSQPVSTTLTANSSTPFTVTFTPPTPGLFTDTVTIANNDPDKNPFTFVISGTGLAPDLALVKSVTPATATPGQMITYTLAFSNAGVGSASGVIITDSMPISLTPISIDSSGVTLTQNGLTFEIESLSTEQGGLITLTAQINSNLKAGSVTNTAQIGSSTPEIDDSNNSDSAQVTVIVPTVTLALSGSPIAEAGGTATITATLSTAAALPVTVTLGYNGTATHLDDYTRSASHIVIPAGNLAGTVAITAVQDTLDELNETVGVEIAAVSNALESGSQQVTATIIDDDGAGLTTTPTSLSLTEPNGTAVITLTLTSQPTATVTINLSRDDATECDITPTSVVLDDNNWSSGAVFTVTVTDDIEVDGNQSCVITGLTTSLDPAYSGQGFAITATIIDDDTERDSIYLPLILTE